MSRHRAQSISDSTARGLRTAYQSVVGLIGLVPTLITIFALIPTDTPGYSQIAIIMANVVLWTGIASKVINALEDKGLIPAPWKQVTAEPVTAQNKGEINGRQPEAV